MEGQADLKDGFTGAVTLGAQLSFVLKLRLFGTVKIVPCRSYKELHE
jgi:hypothetical protein